MWYNKKVEKKSKYLMIALILIITLSIFLTYKRSFVDKNFELITEE